MSVALSLTELRRVLGLETVPADAAQASPEPSFTRLAGFDDAGPESIVFAADAAAVGTALSSAAGMVLVPAATVSDDPRALPADDPRLAFARLGRWFESFVPAVLHPLAQIDPAAQVGAGSSVGAGTVIEAGARVGEGCTLAANVTVYAGTKIGDRVLVQAGAVLGAMGFGYVRGPDGRYIRFPQQGRLVIEDDVEIGANTTIDRGALGETRIGRGTKIDNLVHIGHNCRIGENVIIAAQVGISGSCVVEDGAVLAGQVGISDHCRIGAGLVLGGQAGVFRGKAVAGRPGEAFAGTPAEPIADYLKSIAEVRRLRKRR